jgi:hypothetical protein
VSPGRAATLTLVLALAAGARTAAAQTWRTITSARQLHGERELMVQVQYGAGIFRLSPATEGQLYRMEMRYDEDKFTPVREYLPASGVLRLGARGHDGVRVSLGDRKRSDPPPSLDVAVSPEIPLSLELELGAVQATVDLGGLLLRHLSYRTGASETHLRFGRPNGAACDEVDLEAGAAQFEVLGLGNANCRRLHFSGGVGEVTLDFSGAWRQAMDAEINMGLGSLHVRLPRDVGVSVELSRFLASFDAPGFTKRGDNYYSGNWATATQRLTLHINASLGGIDLAWVDAGR